MMSSIVRRHVSDKYSHFLVAASAGTHRIGRSWCVTEMGVSIDVLNERIKIIANLISDQTKATYYC
jgi:hypothetical protein